ncbi:MAG: amidohydrolase family protein [Eubacteriales bacterium]
MFIETHMHISLNGENSAQVRLQIADGSIDVEDYIRKIIVAYKSRGILAIRDGGDPLNLYEHVRRIAREGGIIYKTPVHAIYKEGYYGSLIGKPIKDLYDFKNMMNSLLPCKPDFVKIPLSGMMNFDSYGDTGEIGFTYDEFYYIVNYAKDKGLPVMVHVNSSQGVKMAIKAKVDTIEHGYFMDSEDLHALKEAGTIWVPTLAPLGNIIYSNDQRFKRQIPVIRKIFEGQCHNVFEGYNLGVKIAVGSDAGAYHVYHGSGFFDELLYLNKAGIGRKVLMEISYQNGIQSLNMSQEEIDTVNATVLEDE